MPILKLWSIVCISRSSVYQKPLPPNLQLKPPPKITFWKATIFLKYFIFKYRESRRDKHSEAVQYLFTISSSKALEPGNNPFVQSNHLPTPNWLLFTNTKYTEHLLYMANLKKHTYRYTPFCKVLYSVKKASTTKPVK